MFKYKLGFITLIIGLLKKIKSNQKSWAMKVKGLALIVKDMSNLMDKMHIMIHLLVAWLRHYSIPLYFLFCRSNVNLNQQHALLEP